MKSKLGLTLVLCSWIAAPSVAQGQSILDWARGRGLAGAEPFDDAISVPGELLRPWIDRERGFAMLGASVGRNRWQLPGSNGRELGYDLRLDGELSLAADSYEPIVGMWGTSSRANLRFALGGSSEGAHSEFAAELGTGALLTLDRRGSGAVARITGSGAGVIEPGAYAVLTNVGVPFGFAVNKLRWYGELLLWPSLGWAAIDLNKRNTGTGPLFLGGILRLGQRTTWLEASYLRSAIEAEVESTRVSVCSQFEPVTFCTDGWWLDVHDVLDEEAARYARVGVRLGIGSSVWRTAESLVRTFR
ncbi:MAG: hypothetical protein ACM3ZE_02345 [Myxococcales bacterium]